MGEPSTGARDPGWLPPRPAPTRRPVAQSAMWVVLAVLAVVVLVFAGRALLTVDRGDENGKAFIDVLDREADRLDAPVPLGELAAFDWDHVDIVPPYDTDPGRGLLGDADLPATGEHESLIVFTSRGRLSGWAMLDPETDRRLGLRTTCVYTYEPQPRSTTYLSARRGNAFFSSATGEPLEGIPYGGCLDG